MLCRMWSRGTFELASTTQASKDSSDAVDPNAQYWIEIPPLKALTPALGRVLATFPTSLRESSRNETTKLEGRREGGGGGSETA